MLVGLLGFEPRWPCGRLFLRQVRLPFHHRPTGRDGRTRTYTRLILNQVPLPIRLHPHGRRRHTTTAPYADAVNITQLLSQGQILLSTRPAIRQQAVFASRVHTVELGIRWP